jgi:CheY-like chemotaxis protein
MAEILKALTSLVWPLLVAVILWHLMPSIKKLIESRAFTLKIAGLEITAQEATDQIKSQLQDLKDQVISLRKASGERIDAIPTPTIDDQTPRTILWVDDKPSNNALEISQLESRGYKVVTALSTNEAMADLARERVGLIISDMGRREEGRYVAQAGVVLLKLARQAGYEQPFIVYSSARYSERNDAEIKASDGVGATASPTKLLEWIQTYLPSTSLTALQNS